MRHPRHAHSGRRAGHHDHAGGHHHHAGGPEHRDHFGNPRDLKAYLKRLEGPARARWQQPDAVVRALGLRSGQTVAEIGAGPGYFTLRLANAVGKRGRVLAGEVEPRMLVILRERLERRQITNVTPVLGSQDDPFFPAGSVDQILMVNTFHHLQDGVRYLRGLERCLKPGGRIVIIDFHDRELPVGPPAGEKVGREELVALAKRARLSVVAEHFFLSHQYFLVLAR